jgi:hypothetical protein
MERVSLIEGSEPILLVCPHGCDDIATDYITETIANSVDGYAVINHGWRRTSKPDILNGKANCNNYGHCNIDVVKEEFLMPILRFEARIRKDYFGQPRRIRVFIIHGIADNVRKLVNRPDLDILIGCGGGKNPSPTCLDIEKIMFCNYLVDKGINVCEGLNTLYAGRSPENLNQLFKLHYNYDWVSSMQIEITRNWREPQSVAELIAKAIANSIIELNKFPLIEMAKVARI